MSDLISRQAAIEAIMEEFEKWLYGHGICSPNIHESIPCDAVPLLIDDAISELPSAQPEPAIPLSWIENHIAWLKNMDNSFSALTALQISTMVQKWKDEQNE